MVRGKIFCLFLAAALIQISPAFAEDSARDVMLDGQQKDLASRLPIKAAPYLTLVKVELDKASSTQTHHYNLDPVKPKDELEKDMAAWTKGLCTDPQFSKIVPFNITRRHIYNINKTSDQFEVSLKTEDCANYKPLPQDITMVDFYVMDTKRLQNMPRSLGGGMMLMDVTADNAQKLMISHYEVDKLFGTESNTQKYLEKRRSKECGREFTKELHQRGINLKHVYHFKDVGTTIEILVSPETCS